MELIKKQIMQTQTSQINWQAIVLTAVKKHGRNKEKVMAEIKKMIEPIAARLVEKSIRLGMQWIKE